MLIVENSWFELVSVFFGFSDVEMMYSSGNRVNMLMMIVMRCCYLVLVNYVLKL